MSILNNKRETWYHQTSHWILNTFIQSYKLSDKQSKCSRLIYYQMPRQMQQSQNLEFGIKIFEFCNQFGICALGKWKLKLQYVQLQTIETSKTYGKFFPFPLKIKLRCLFQVWRLRIITSFPDRCFNFVLLHIRHPMDDHRHVWKKLDMDQQI